MYLSQDMVRWRSKVSLDSDYSCEDGASPSFFSQVSPSFGFDKFKDTTNWSGLNMKRLWNACGYSLTQLRGYIHASRICLHLLLSFRLRTRLCRFRVIQHRHSALIACHPRALQRVHQICPHRVFHATVHVRSAMQQVAMLEQQDSSCFR